jgi:hypothetical protein
MTEEDFQKWQEVLSKDAFILRTDLYRLKLQMESWDKNFETFLEHMAYFDKAVKDGAIPSATSSTNAS